MKDRIEAFLADLDRTLAPSAQYLFNLEKDGDEFRDSAFRSLRIVLRYLRHEIDSF